MFPYNALFELSGHTLAAVKQLEKEIRTELKTVPVKRTGLMQEIDASWQSMYKGLLARLEAENPEMLELLGLKTPAIRVSQALQTLPRAYVEYPHIFKSPEKEPRYFMYAPIDYKGNHFTPADSRYLDGEEASRADDLLFAGGWLGNAPLIDVKKHGVPTPADYSAPTASELRKQFHYIRHDRACFLAAGRSLEIAQDYQKRTQEYRARTDEIRKEFKKEILPNLPAGKDINVIVESGYVDDPYCCREKLLLSVRRQGKDVALPASPAYHADRKEELYGDRYIITPRRDTPEGQKIATLLDSIPLTPWLRDYPELYDIDQDTLEKTCGVDGVVPRIDNIEDHAVLLYNTAPGGSENPFCPPGAKPLPAEVYEWLRADAGDRNMGITPPPRPPEVTRVLANLFPAAPGNSAQPKPGI